MEKDLVTMFCLGMAVAVSGCSFGSLRVEPSGYGLTPAAVEFADELESSDETTEFHPIAYVAEGKSTNRCAKDLDWFLLYTGLEKFGKLEEGYAYEDASILWPVWVGLEAYRYNAEGDTIGSRHVDSLGPRWPFPAIIFASIFVERNRDLRVSEGHTDFGLKLLQLPVVDTCLLKLSSGGFDLFFIPLWAKDRSPRSPKSGEEQGPAPAKDSADETTKEES